MEHEQFMRIALQEAIKAEERGEVPIGAVVVAGGRIIARAHNLVESLCDPTAHAEMQAITAAASAVGGKYLDQCTLYVTIEPCPMCAAAMYWAQIGCIVWGADDPKRGFTTLDKNLLHPKTLIIKGVFQSDCAELVSGFFKKLRQKI